jgi:CubicO group peptidase (beta-lactamase class C family)
VDDLALWAEALSGGKLLKRESLERMTTPSKLSSGQSTKGGYGIQIFEEDGKRILAHGGGIPGFNTYLLSIPSERLQVVVLSNVAGHSPGPGGLGYRVAMKALGKPVEDRKAMNLDPATLDEYTGLYRFDETRSQSVFREGTKLFAQGTGGDRHEILAASRDDFFYRDLDPRIHFRRDAKGKVTGMDLQYSFGPADETGMKVDDPGLNLSFADALASEDQLSGAVLVARNGKVLLQKAWGLADREKGTSITLDTQFRVGSMNKMFTSVATLQLVEAGKLSLDDPIGKYLPDYPNKDVATKVTVRHLLTHTGGTGDIFGPQFVKNRLALKEHGDYLKLYGSRGLTHEPGAQFEYSNYGFVLLGAIIEKVTGMSYYDYVRSRVFQPAGMTSTDSLPEAESVPNRAAGYMRGEGGWVPNTDTLPWRGTSAGGGYSTVGDLLRFVQALESGKLISKAMLAEATRQNPRRYGYGFQVFGEGRSRSYGHSGGAPGINGDLRVFPELGYVVVGLANLDPPSVSRVVDSLALRIQVTQ